MSHLLRVGCTGRSQDGVVRAIGVLGNSLTTLSREASVAREFTRKYALTFCGMLRTCYACSCDLMHLPFASHGFSSAQSQGSLQVRLVSLSV